MKIMKSGDKRIIILPKKLCVAMNWQPGDRLKVNVVGKNRMELQKEVKDNLSVEQ